MQFDWTGVGGCLEIYFPCFWRKSKFHWVSTSFFNFYINQTTVLSFLLKHSWNRSQYNELTNKLEISIVSIFVRDWIWIQCLNSWRCFGLVLIGLACIGHNRLILLHFKSISSSLSHYCLIESRVRLFDLFYLNLFSLSHISCFTFFLSVSD